MTLFGAPMTGAPMSDAPNPSNAPAPALLSAWLEQSHDLLVMTDALGQAVWSNRRFQTATGNPSQATNVLSLLHPNPGASVTHDVMRAAVQHALRTGSLAADSELCLRSADGTPLWVRALTTRVENKLLWTLQDITAAHQFAALAQRQFELLEMTQEFGRLGVWEREIPSGAGRWDRHVFGFWGMPPNSATPDYADAIRRVHPDDRSASIYEQSTQHAGRYSQRYRVMQPDGGMRWIHSQWEVKNSPEGRPVRTLGIMMDDTEAYELARSLDNTSAQLELAVDLANIVIWRHDLKSNRLHFNERGYTLLGAAFRPEGFTLDEMRALIHPDDLARVQNSAREALGRSTPTDIEARFRRSDGSWRCLLTRRVVERGVTGEAVAFVGVALDVTERAEHLRRAEALGQRLEAAAQAARMGIWTTTAGNEQTEWNAQMYELFDMVGEPRPPSLLEWLERCVHPDDSARVRRAAGAYLSAKPDAPFEVEFRTLRRDGMCAGCWCAPTPTAATPTTSATSAWPWRSRRIARRWPRCMKPANARR